MVRNDIDHSISTDIRIRDWSHIPIELHWSICYNGTKAVNGESLISWMQSLGVEYRSAVPEVPSGIFYVLLEFEALGAKL